MSWAEPAAEGTAFATGCHLRKFLVKGSAMKGTTRRTVGRALLAASGAMVVASAAPAQQSRPRRIAWLSEAPHPFVGAFRSGLADAGLVEQRDFVISTHYLDGPTQR